MSICPPTSSPTITLHVGVEPILQPFMAAAATRLGYSHPALKFGVEGNGVVVTGSVADETVMRREVLHAVYREHILERTLPLRHSLLAGLMRS